MFYDFFTICKMSIEYYQKNKERLLKRLAKGIKTFQKKKKYKKQKYRREQYKFFSEEQKR